MDPNDPQADLEPDYVSLPEWRKFESRLTVLLKGVRQVLIIALGCVEDFLGMPRSIVPRRKRGAF